MEREILPGFLLCLLAFVRVPGADGQFETSQVPVQATVSSEPDIVQADAHPEGLNAYIFNHPHAWDKMPQSSRDQTRQDAHKWDVMMSTGTLFPAITSQAVQRISAPVLIFMAANSYPFLGVIGRELARLLPKSETFVFPNAGHQMSLQDPEACRKDVENLLAIFGIR